MLHEIPKITQPKKTKMYSKLRRIQLELRSEKLPQTIFANRLLAPKINPIYDEEYKNNQSL